jgi:hypothetical protein
MMKCAPRFTVVCRRVLVAGAMLLLGPVGCGGRTVEEDFGDGSSGGHDPRGDSGSGNRDDGSAGRGSSGGRSGSDPIDQVVTQVCAQLPADSCEGCLCSSCGSTFVDCALNTACMQTLQCVVMSGCSAEDCLDPSTCQAQFETLMEEPGAQSMVTGITLCLGAGVCPCG